MIEEYNDGHDRKYALDKSSFHDNGRFVDAFFFKKMMERCYQKKLFFEIFFSEYLEKTWE